MSDRKRKKGPPPAPDDPRYRRTCTCAGQPLVVTAPPPDKLIPKSYLGISLWTLGEAWRAATRNQNSGVALLGFAEEPL